MAAATPTATPTKLRSGAWGARVPGRAQVGQTITIQTRAGKTWEAEIERVLWSGTGRDGGPVSLCATRSLDRAPARRRRYRSGDCGCPCGCDGESGGCRDCDRDCAQMG